MLLFLSSSFFFVWFGLVEPEHSKYGFTSTNSVTPEVGCRKRCDRLAPNPQASGRGSHAKPHTEEMVDIKLLLLLFAFLCRSLINGMRGGIVE